MSEIPQVVTLLFMASVAVLTVFQFWRRWRSMQRDGPHFPGLNDVKVQFRERGASGRSLLNFSTRIGGGRNVIEVVVTDSELWIRAPLPFAVVAHGFDGLHRVSLSEVSVVSHGRRKVVVEFPRADGRTVGFELWLRDVTSFVQALGSTAGMEHA